MAEITPEQAAKYFKYLLQFKLSYIVRKLDLKQVPSKSFYTKHKKKFDTLVAIFNKYQIDVISYLKFFINDYGRSENNIEKELVDVKSIDAFIQHMKEEERKVKIYGWFMKSVNNIARDCIDLGFLSSKDYLREMIMQRKLAGYYLTGKISKYWFAGIPSFKKVILVLDNLSRDEFNDLFEKFDIYNTEINKASMKMKNCKVNPIKITDEVIFQMRNAQA